MKVELDALRDTRAGERLTAIGEGMRKLERAVKAAREEAAKRSSLPMVPPKTWEAGMSLVDMGKRYLIAY